MARRTLTDNSIEELKPRTKRYTVPDPKLAGHYVRVTPKGAKSFVAVSRDPAGKQVWHTIGSTYLFSLEEARERAREKIKAIKDGISLEAQETVAAVAEEWFSRHVEKRGLRSATALRTQLDKHILPEWSGLAFEGIRRSHITKLLDKIEDSAGASAADHLLSTIRSITNFYAARHDEYITPIIRGMRRINPKATARDRVLDDDEIRAVWAQAELNGIFGVLVRLLLLTGQRRIKVTAMRWQDISPNGVWTIPTEAREKGNAQELRLPEIALEIIRSRPQFAGNPYVLAGRGKSHFNNFAADKKLFDERCLIAPWRLHDLRRTARSLMTRVGIISEHAERVLGHEIDGVEGIYNRHQYTQEKAHALKALAGLIETIVNPPAENVVSLSRAQ